MGRRVTLRDVAEAAGVTTATVSYVINNTPGQKITEPTRQRVMEAVERLHYTPNNAARALKSRSSGCVGVVIKKNLAVPRFSQTLQGIQSVLDEAGLGILLCTNAKKANGFSDYVSAYLERRVDGVVFLGKDNQGPDKQSRALIESEDIPFVAFDCLEDCAAYSTVDFDYLTGARLMTSRVLTVAPAEVLYLRPSMDTPQERLREQGVRAAVDRADVKFSMATLPIVKENLELWDKRYSLGYTREGDELTGRVLDEMVAAVSALPDGAAVISSWSGWSELVRAACPERRLTYAELANNGETCLHARFWTRLPNYEAGCACAEEILARIERKPSTARTIRLTDIHENKLVAQAAS